MRFNPPPAPTSPAVEVAWHARQMQERMAAWRPQEIANDDGELFMVLAIIGQGVPQTPWPLDSQVPTPGLTDHQPATAHAQQADQISQDLQTLIATHPLTRIGYDNGTGRELFAMAQFIGYTPAVPLAPPHRTADDRGWELIGGYFTHDGVSWLLPTTRFDFRAGVIGVLCLTRDMKAGDVVDVMTSGEIVDCASPIAAGTVITADTTTGALGVTAASATKTPHRLRSGGHAPHRAQGRSGVRRDLIRRHTNT